MLIFNCIILIEWKGTVDIKESGMPEISLNKMTEINTARPDPMN